MNERWVVNASPIIVLAKAGLEQLFTKMADEVLRNICASQKPETDSKMNEAIGSVPKGRA